MADTQRAEGVDSLATRSSLLGRLQHLADQTSWREFFDRYHGLIRRFALKSGCTETEADEVVQETVISVARNLPQYRHDPQKCAFKTWLLNQTSWRVKDQLRKRSRWESRIRTDAELAYGGDDDAEQTPAIERVADDSAERMALAWEQEWQHAVLAMALDRVKAEANPKDCQMFELLALRGMAPSEVARTLGVSKARVYLAKHRLGPLVRKHLTAIALDVGP